MRTWLGFDAWRLICVVVVALLASSCSTGAGDAEEPQAWASSSEPVAVEQTVQVNGNALTITCRGEGTPTVVFEAGAGGDDQWFWRVQDAVRRTTRTCSYTRAGINAPRPADNSPVTIGSLSDELRALLDGGGINGPYVLVAHSMGGMVAQVFASRNEDDVVGIVFDDSSVAAQVGRKDPVWEDGPGNPVDMVASRRELLNSGDFGDIPVVVLTQNFADTNEYDSSQQSWWRRQHTALARRSTNSIHVLAVTSGHMIQEQQPELVIAATNEVVASARAGQPLEACDSRFDSVDGQCLPA